MNRRGFLTGVGLVAAPAVITIPGLLMPVRTWHDGIPGQIGWVVDQRPFPRGNLYIRAVISDGRRWRPLLSRLDLVPPGPLVDPRLVGRLVGHAPVPPGPLVDPRLVGHAPVDGPAAICA